MTNVSYQRLLNNIEQFAAAHLMIKKFGADFEPQMPNFATKDEGYPILYITPISSLLEQNQTNFTIYAYCWDIIQKDRENITTILSDTHQILSDLDIWMRNGDIDDIDVLDNSTIEPLNNGLLDYCAGWRMTITFNCDNYSICEIPFDTTVGPRTQSYLYPPQGPRDIYVTGATYNSGTTTLTLYRNDNYQISVTGITAGSGGGSSTIQGITGATNGTGISTSITDYNLTITNTAPDQTVTITGGTNIQINGSYPSFGVNFTGSTVDTYVTGFTYSNNTLTINQNEGKNPLSVVVNTMTGLTVNGRITTDNILFNTGATTTLETAALQWNDTDGTLDLRLKGNNVTLQIGQEEVVRVVNKTGGNLLEADYKVVRPRTVAEGGAQGQRLAVVLAQADTELHSAQTLGVVTENISVNQEGYITTSGLVRAINTTGSIQGETWVDGDILYLSPSIAGGLTNVKPTAPDNLVIVGYVIYSHINNGTIFVKVDNGYELDELHNVLITSPQSGQVLKYNGSIWVNSTDLTVTGGTYTNGTATFTNNTGGTFSVTGFNTTTQGITGLTANNGLSASTTSNVTTIGFSGGNISNSVNFTNGLSANTISATTYYNLPTIQASVNVFGSSLTATSTYSHYIFSGSSTGQTLSLPTLVGNTNVRITVKNRSSAVLAVASQSASQIYTWQTNTTLYLNVGEAYEFINDGTYWIVV